MGAISPIAPMLIQPLLTTSLHDIFARIFANLESYVENHLPNFCDVFSGCRVLLQSEEKDKS